MSSNKRVALVTGSTDGIGRHTAIQLAKKGYRVGIHGRSQKRIDAAVQMIKSEAAGAEIDTFCFDLSTLQAAKDFCAAVLGTYQDSGLQLLFNNAGVFMDTKEITSDGLEMTFAVNVVAVFTIFSSLLPLLRKTSTSSIKTAALQTEIETRGELSVETRGEADSLLDVRILNVSSISMEDGPNTLDMKQLENILDGSKLTPYDSYGISKRFVAMLSFSLSELLRAEGTKIPVLTCDPGTVNTKMLLAGWGACGIGVEDANTQLKIMTEISFNYDELDGKYWNGSTGVSANGVARCERKMHEEVHDKQKRDVLWSWLVKFTGIDPSGAAIRICPSSDGTVRI